MRLLGIAPLFISRRSAWRKRLINAAASIALSCASARAYGIALRRHTDYLLRQARLVAGAWQSMTNSVQLSFGKPPALEAYDVA